MAEQGRQQAGGRWAINSAESRSRGRGWAGAGAAAAQCWVTLKGTGGLADAFHRAATKQQLQDWVLLAQLPWPRTQHDINVEDATLIRCVLGACNTGVSVCIFIAHINLKHHAIHPCIPLFPALRSGT